MIERTPTKAFMVIVAAVMAVTSLILGIFTWSQIAESIDAAEKSRELSVKWEHMLSVMKDAETGQRGYLLTGDVTYLQAFDYAVAELPRVFEELARLEVGTGGSVGEVAETRALAERRLAVLEKVISVQRKEGFEAARELIVGGEGKRLMDELRTRIRIIEAGLDTTAVDRTRRMHLDLRWGYVSALSAGLVALGAGAVALLLFRDSLRQLRREEHLAAGKLRAEQADREKSTFLATMSHEIRTPMNAILGFGELLEGEVQTEREQRHVQSILAGGRSLLQIINDILDLSKIEAGMMEVRPEPTDLEELAQFVRQLFAQQAALKGIAFHIETGADLPRALLLDGVRMRQILLNIVGNALKFTDQGHVLVRLGGDKRADERSRWRLTVEIEDTGVGIPEAQLTDVFKPFVQARDKREAGGRGTGLGLAIVQRLTDLMGGSIAVDSEVGRGTTFTLEFPQVEICARLPQTFSSNERRVDFNDLRASSIVVADDNETNRTLILGIFENTHHLVRLVSDGQEAVEAIAELRPDVVLMDVRMPVMDGREALEVLRAQPGLEVMPVIAVTASSLASEEATLRRTFDGFVRKPFSRAELFRELAHFIPRRRPHHRRTRRTGSGGGCSPRSFAFSNRPFGQGSGTGWACPRSPDLLRECAPKRRPRRVRRCWCMQPDFLPTRSLSPSRPSRLPFWSFRG
jgi:signal transduction histidine kinase/CheY-like chemotaxis protein